MVKKLPFYEFDSVSKPHISSGRRSKAESVVSRDDDAPISRYNSHDIRITRNELKILKPLKILFTALLLFCAPVYSYFDFGMKADEAQKKLAEYYQTILVQIIPQNQLKQLQSGGGYLDLVTDWFKSYFSKPSHNMLSTKDIEKIQAALIARLAIYSFLFNKYNALINPNNILQQPAPLEEGEIKKALENWSNDDFIKTLVVTGKDNKVNSTHLNNYFNFIINTLDIGLEPDFKKKSPEEILIKLAEQWSKLPKENNIKLLEQLAKHPEKSLIKALCQNITPTRVYEIIKNGFNKYQGNAKAQAPYVFLAKLVDKIFRKTKQAGLREAVENYLNPTNGPKRTYKELLDAIDQDPQFLYNTFGTTSNASSIKEWIDEAIKGKKTSEMVEDAHGRLVPKREKPNPELRQFLEKVIEYNPLLYVGDNPILRTIYADIGDPVTKLAEAFSSIH